LSKDRFSAGVTVSMMIDVDRSFPAVVELKKTRGGGAYVI
jgi:hypothetical protein